MRFAKIIISIFVCVIVLNTSATIFSKNINNADSEVKCRENKVSIQNNMRSVKQIEDISNYYNTVWKFHKDEDPDGPILFMPFYVCFNNKYLLLFDENRKDTCVYTIKTIKNNAMSAKLTFVYKVDEKGKMTKDVIKDDIKISVKLNKDTVYYNDGESGAILIKTSENPSQIYPERLVAEFLHNNFSK